MMMMMMVMVQVMVVVVMMMIVGLLAQACYWAASCTRHSFATQWQGDDDDYVECDDDNDDGGGDDDDSDLITTSVNMVTKRPENRSSLVSRLCKRLFSEFFLLPFQVETSCCIINFLKVDFLSKINQTCASSCLCTRLRRRLPLYILIRFFSFFSDDPDLRFCLLICFCSFVSDYPDLCSCLLICFCSLSFV